MDAKVKLTLLKRPQELPVVNNYWRCCPLANDYLPETTCPEGAPKLVKGKVQEEPPCAWWLNSPNHNFCFWRYLKDKSDPNGVMKELSQSELASLFGWSDTKTHFMLKQAIVDLTEAMKLHGAADLLQDLEEGDPDSEVSFNGLFDPSCEEPIE